MRVAKRISVSRVSRHMLWSNDGHVLSVEQGHAALNRAELASLLDLLGVHGERRDELERLRLSPARPPNAAPCSLPPWARHNPAIQLAAAISTRAVLSFDATDLSRALQSFSTEASGMLLHVVVDVRLITHASWATVNWLLHLAHNESAVVQIHNSMRSMPFMVLSFEGGADVACCDSANGPQVCTVPASVDDLSNRFAELTAGAFDEADSRYYLEQWTLG